MWNFAFFATRQITDARLFVYFFVFVFFSPRVIVSTQWSKTVVRGLILTEIKSSSALFQWQKKWRAPRPPPTLIFPQSHRIKILRKPIFSAQSKNLITISLGTIYSPTVPVEPTASYKLWPVFAYSIGSWEMYTRFQGDFSVGGKVWGEGLCGGKVWGEEVMRGELPMKEFVMGEENFHEGGAGFFSIFLNNNEKINMKKFFQLKGRSSIKT